MIQLVMVPQSQCSRKKGGLSRVRFWNNECPDLMIWYCNDFFGKQQEHWGSVFAYLQFWTGDTC